jgi:hypothetical protein
MSDCRKKFNPLTEQECCCTYTVGDGIRSNGDYNSIQEAIDSLPAYGGKICVLPGEHEANVVIKGRRQVRISGCGDQSIVRPGPNAFAQPIFFIQNSQRIQIDQLTLVAIDGTCIQLEDNREGRLNSEKIKINDNRLIAGIQALHIHTREDVGGANRIEISYNEIGMLDQREGRPAIFSVADDVLIERNRIVVIPDQNSDDPDDPRDPNDPGDPFNPCRDRRTPQRGAIWKYQIYVLIRYVAVYKALGRYKKEYLAQGGIQIGGTSEKVWILENEIIGGRGNGITLGHVSENANDANSFTYKAVNVLYAALYDIKIEGNRILQMGLSGISTLLVAGERQQQYVHVEDVTIAGNLIKYCALQMPAEIPQSLLNDWAFGGIVLSDCENGRINENLKVLLQATVPMFDDVPAVSLHDNVIEQPLGHALLLTAFGPVAVANNQFASLGTDRTNTLSFIASTVLILDLGVSKDTLIKGFVNLANTNPAGFSKLASDPAFQNMLRALQFLPSGKVLFNDNQTILNMLSPVNNIGISSQFIGSLDDISYSSNQSELAGLLSAAGGNTTFDIVLVNTMLVGASLRSNDNRFMDGFTLTVYSLFSYGMMNTATGNQATHCLITLGAMRAVNSNIVLFNDPCKDQATLAGNKLAVPAGKDF